MSESYEDPQQPTPEDYRRRRIIAAVVLVLVLLLILWGIVALINAIRGSGEDTSSQATVATSTSAKPFSDFSARASDSASASASESADPSESATASESAQASESAESSESAEPSESATETPEPTASETATEHTVVACTASDLSVTLAANQMSYAAGQNPELTITYTNNSKNPCDIPSDVQSVDINITSGPAQVFNSSQCQVEVAPKVELAAGQSGTTAMTWGRQLNALGCANPQPIRPGVYWATATVNNVASQPVRITITG